MVQAIDWYNDDWSHRCDAFRTCLERLFEEYPVRPEHCFPSYYRSEALYHARRGQIHIARHYAGMSGVPDDRITAILTLLG